MGKDSYRPRGRGRGRPGPVLEPPRPRWQLRLPAFLLLAAAATVLAWVGLVPIRLSREVDRYRKTAWARTEVAHLAEQVRLFHLSERRYPDDPRRFLATGSRLGTGRDPWGGEYLLEVLPGTEFEVRSPGPDGRPYSRDDLVRRGTVLPP